MCILTGSVLLPILGEASRIVEIAGSNALADVGGIFVLVNTEFWIFYIKFDFFA